MKNTRLTIIAGPCSVDESNIDEIYDIANIRVNGKRVIAGTRVVGLKSRTAYSSYEGMGIDHDAYMQNQRIAVNGHLNKERLIPLPSVKIAERIHKDTGLLIASEIVDPIIQLSHYDGTLKGAFMPWNPAVNQLGWHINIMARFAEKNDWLVGIKNGKWIGEDVAKAESPDYSEVTSLEKVWSGLVTYSGETTRAPILIHRGVDVHDKKNFRNVPIHNTAGRVKLATGCRLYFDPSHVHGPRMKEEIVPATIRAMNMKISNDEYLYDGILIEVGSSRTDTEQHISINELAEIAERVREFREFASRPVA